MLYIVKAYEDGEVYEYEYGLLEHALAHLQNDLRAEWFEVYEYKNGVETRIKTRIRL